MPVRVPKDTRNKVEQTKQRMNGAPVSQHGGNTSTEVSSTVRKQTSVWRLPAHSGGDHPASLQAGETAAAEEETKR